MADHPAAAGNEGDLSGFLLKEGAGIVKSYKRRWFVLRGPVLEYFTDAGDAEPTGQIDLRSTSVEPVAGLPLAMTIAGPKLERSYRLRAESQTELDRWLAAIQHAQQPPTKGDVREAPVRTDMSVEDFEQLGVLGRGSFGKVSKVRCRRTGVLYAMKEIRKALLVKDKLVQNTRAERAILQSVDHPYIVKLHYAFQSDRSLFLVLDLLPGGELFHHLKSERCFPEPRARLYAAEVTSALVYLHSKGIVYRDLKPENIVLDKGGHACLTDMGLAKSAMEHTQQTYTFCGTPEYIAPEMLRGEGHNRAVDWWALGILLYEMLTGMPPFYSESTNDMYELILHKQVLYPPSMGREAVSLVSQLLVRDPLCRLVDSALILRHPFFAPIDWDRLLRKEIKPQWVPDACREYIEEEEAAAGNAEPAASDPSEGGSPGAADPAKFASFCYTEPTENPRQ